MTIKLNTIKTPLIEHYDKNDIEFAKNHILSSNKENFEIETLIPFLDYLRQSDMQWNGSSKDFSMCYYLYDNNEEFATDYRYYNRDIDGVNEMTEDEEDEAIVNHVSSLVSVYEINGCLIIRKDVL